MLGVEAILLGVRTCLSLGHGLVTAARQARCGAVLQALPQGDAVSGGPRWSEAERALLRKLAPTHTCGQMTQFINRSAQSICAQASRMGVPVLPWKPAPWHPWRRPLTKKGHEHEAARLAAMGEA